MLTHGFFVALSSLRTCKVRSAAAVVLILYATIASADDYFRIEPGLWHDPDAWINMQTGAHQVPGGSDLARTSGGQLEFGSNASVGRVQVAGGDNFFLFDGTSLTVNNGLGFGIGVADAGGGSFWLQGAGTVYSNGALIADGVDGNLTVTGAEMVLNDTALINVGVTATGTLLVDDFATVNANEVAIGGDANSSGTASLHNATFNISGVLTVANLGTGLLEINDSVLDTGALAVGAHPGAYGDLLINAGGIVRSNVIRIGPGGGEGITTVSDGGRMTAFDLVIGALSTSFDGSGTLNVASGGTVEVNNNLVIGGNSQSQGLLSVFGTLKSNRLLVVGDGGGGKLLIHSNAEVTVTDFTIGDLGPGEVTIEDIVEPMSPLNLIVGASDNGILRVNAGGKIDGSFVVVGDNASGDGDVTIDGDGAYFGFGVLTIGRAGTGTVTVKNKGAIEPKISDTSLLKVGVSAGGVGTLEIDANSQGDFDQIRIGQDSQATGTIKVIGQNALLFAGDRLQVGDAGTGILIIDQGGVASTLTGELGTSATGHGTVTITGQGKWLVRGPLIVNGAQSTINVSGNNSTLEARGVSLENGSIQLSDTGTLAVWESISIAENGLLSIGTGMGRIGDGVAPIPGWLVVGQFGSLSGRGRVMGNVLSAGGVIHPGGSPGKLTIEGDLTADANSLTVFTMQGVAVGDQYSQLLVTGNVDVAGSIALDFENGFAPQVGDVFQLISATGTLSANNIQFDITGLMPGWNYSTALVGGVYQITSLNNATPALPGDFNFDGTVDGADYVTWRMNAGTQHGYDVWRANFGRTNTTGAASSINAPAPEPAALYLLLTAIFFCQIKRPVSKSGVC